MRSTIKAGQAYTRNSDGALVTVRRAEKVTGSAARRWQYGTARRVWYVYATDADNLIWCDEPTFIDSYTRKA